MSEQPAQEAAEFAARQSYSRLLAYLSARTRDVAAAEDALGEAFRVALARWPLDGVPRKPEAWLLTVARRALGHGERHRRVAEAAVPALLLAVEEAEQCAERKGTSMFPDERLKLLFVCAHPAIDAAVHAPLMLQTVLGLDAARIAVAFLATPAAMSQRLVRAKAKIRDAGIGFRVPEADELRERLQPVLDAIYAAYGTGWDDAAGAGATAGPGDLAREAIRLARTLAAMLPDEPEALGLLSLALYCEARRSARRDERGDCVPLALQNAADWNAAMLGEADELLRRAGRLSALGRYQCEAAIQSVHAFRRWGGTTDWSALLRLYDALVGMTAAIGARVSRAGVVGRVQGAKPGLAALAGLEPEARSYQPYWAVRAHLLREAGRTAEAADAYRAAAELSRDMAVRRFLTAQRDMLAN
jgi:RNA polymerase sigma-70 factor (ECF subfamily)